MAYRLMDVLNSDLSLCGQGNLCSNANILKLSTYFPTFPIHAFKSEFRSQMARLFFPTNCILLPPHATAGIRTHVSTVAPTRDLKMPFNDC